MSALNLHAKLTRIDGHNYSIAMILERGAGRESSVLVEAAEAHLTIDWAKAITLQINGAEMGQWLGDLLFGLPVVAKAVSDAKAEAAALEASIRFRLELDPSLQSLPWETMQTARFGSVAASEWLLFSRYLSSQDFRPTQRLRGDSLAIAAVVAAPANLAEYGLASPQADIIYESIQQAAGHEHAKRIRATRQRILRALRDGVSTLCLAAHGAQRPGQPAVLFLETEGGQVDVVMAADVARDFGTLSRLPRLVVLLSCQSAGAGDMIPGNDDALLSLGAQLVEQGVPALIAMRGNITFQTAHQFLTGFFEELKRDWVIDRAVATARRSILPRQDAWAPVLFMRLADGWLARPTALQGEYLPPALPLEFVHRPDIHHKSVATLINSERPDPSQPHSSSVALVGAGGFGKTTLAQALCHDQRLQAAFPDGIIWLTLGEQPGDLLPIINKLTSYLSGSLATAQYLEDARQALAQAIGSQRLLLVLDDIWQTAHATPFIVPQSTCGKLLVTRNRRTIPHNIPVIQIEQMAPMEAVQLLRHGIAGGVNLIWESLAADLGRWPLLLTLANGKLRHEIREGSLVQTALDQTIEEYELLGITGFDSYDETERNRAVRLSLEASINLLQSKQAYGQLVVDERRLFQDMAVFAENIDVPLAALVTYWRAHNLSLVVIRAFCQRLRDLSLLLYYDTMAQTIRLHDVIRKFLADSADMRRSHERILAAYQSIALDGWPSLVDDRYIYQFLAYHLVNAGRLAELQTLLLDFAWLQSKLAHSNIDALLDDFSLALRHNGVPAIMLLAKALSLTRLALDKNHDELESQLIGRLSGSTDDALIALVGKARHEASAAGKLVPQGSSLLSPQNNIVHIMAKHTGTVKSILPITGNRAVSAGDDGKVILWDLTTGLAIRTMAHHTQAVNYAAMLDSTDWLLSGGAEGLLVLCDLDSGELLQTMHHDSSITEVTLPAGRRQAIVGTANGKLSLWELVTGKQIRAFPGHDAEIEYLKLLQDEQWLLSADSDGKIMLWELHSGLRLFELVGHDGRIVSLTILQDAKRALTTGIDGQLILWDLEYGRAIHRLDSGNNSLWLVATLHNSSQALTASTDEGQLILWDLVRGVPIHQLSGHTEGITDAHLIRNGQKAVTAGLDGQLILWDLATGHSEVVVQADPQGVWSITVLSNEQLVVTAGRGGKLRLWELNNGNLVHDFHGHADWIDLALQIDRSNLLLTTDYQGQIFVWDMAECRQTNQLKGHSGTVEAIAVLQEGKFVLSAGADGKVILWDLSLSFSQPPSIQSHSGLVDLIMPLGPSNRVLTAAFDGRLGIWDLASGQLRQMLEGHDDWITEVTLLAGGDKALSGCASGRLLLWDLTSGKLLSELIGHNNIINYIQVFDGETQTITTDCNGTICLWNLSEARRIYRRTGHEKSITQCALIADGQLFLSADHMGKLILWDVASGHVIHSWHDHEEGIDRLVPLSDGRLVLTADKAGQIILWDMVDKKPIRIFSRHTKSLGKILLLDNERKMITASADRLIIVCELATGNVLHTFSGHGSHLIALLDNECLALSQDVDGQLMLWDVASGAMIHQLTGHDIGLAEVQIFDNQRQAISMDRAGHMILWDLRSGTAMSTYTMDGAAGAIFVSHEGIIVAGDALGNVHFLTSGKTAEEGFHE